MKHVARLTVVCLLGATLGISACAQEPDFKQWREAREQLQEVLDDRRQVYRVFASAAETGVEVEPDQYEFPPPREMRWQLEQLEKIAPRLEPLLDTGPRSQQVEVARILSRDDIEWANLRATLSGKSWAEVMNEDLKRMSLLVRLSEFDRSLQDATIAEQKPRTVPPENVEELEQRREAVGEDAQDEVEAELTSIEQQIEQLQQQRVEAMEKAEQARERRYETEGEESYEAELEQVEALKEANLAMTKIEVLREEEEALKTELDRLRRTYEALTDMIEGEIDEVNVPTERRVTGLVDPEEPVDPETGIVEASDRLQEKVRHMESVFDSEVQAAFDAIDSRLERAAERLEEASGKPGIEAELAQACDVDRLRVAAMRAHFQQDRLSTNHQYARALEAVAHWTSQFELPEADDFAVRRDTAFEMFEANREAAEQAIDGARRLLDDLPQMPEGTAAAASVNEYRRLLDTIAERFDRYELDV